jgi:hypothetical protein
MTSPWPLLAAAVLVALAWWPLRRWPARVRWCATLGASGLLGALPWLADRRDLRGLAVLALVAAAAMPAKLFDAATAPRAWRDRRWRAWSLFLFLPFVVCRRAHRGARPRGAGESGRLALRGAAEMAAGATILRVSFAHDWSTTSILLEHGVKLVGLYLLVLDGAFVLATGLFGLAGLALFDLSDHPYRAVTPADFWRRYNRDAGRFFFENLYRRLPFRSPVARTLVVFFANGLVHEYLAWILCGRIVGHALAFFVIHGVATAATARSRPTGLARLAARLGTLIFLFASAGLILAAVDAVVPWYQPRAVRSPASGAHRDRVAERLDGRHAVLPPPARVTAEEVGRARLGLEREDVGLLPWIPGIAPKADAAGREEREADDRLVVRDVAVPAERRARLVLRDQRLHEVLRSDADPGGGLRPQLDEKGGEGWGRRLLEV